jgi:23S rRNA pseudouridine1911/1915/1917 synthase
VQLQVLYEDDVLLFVNKPPNVVVQRGFDPEEICLLDVAEQYTSPVFLMQRLDRGTSGVMFFSKRASVNRALTRFFERKRIHKRYLALCEGEIGEAQTIDAPLIRIGAIKFAVGDGGRRAVTHIKPLASSPKGSLVEVHLETGRTHQIRVHMAAIGHPLVGDWLYGERDAGRPMLHSAELVMPHPLSGQTVRVAAPLPEDFEAERARRGLVPAGGQTDTSRVQLNY